MAKLYSQERSKYGNLTGQIIVWPVEISPDINAESNIKKLPSGYLRCDGAIYNAVDYPALSVVCGTGSDNKFVRKDLAGNALQTITDAQFIVPDLSSKYPLPTPGADAGVYKNIRVTNSNDDEVSRSGIGIEASSTLGATLDVTYSGTFTVPSQVIDLKGRPSWTWGTTDGKRTSSEVVDVTAIAGHMHFGNHVRTRIKSQAETDPTSPSIVKDPQAIGLVAYWNSSTIPIDDWVNATVINGTAGTPPTYPGNSQPACRAIASNIIAKNYQFYFGAFAGNIDPTAYGGQCYNGGNTLIDQWRTRCLITDNWNNFPVNTDPYKIAPGINLYSTSGTNTLLFGCYLDSIPSQPQQLTASQTLPKTYFQGAAGVPLDWKDASCHDVVPFNSNLNTDSSRIYASLFNEMTESLDLVQSADPTSHFHKVDLDRGDHSFKLVTNALELSPDSLDTTLTLAVDNAVSVDSVSSPFIVLEYLIKI